eukprot:2201694-Amphidinium_carterae.1
MQTKRGEILKGKDVSHSGAAAYTAPTVCDDCLRAKIIFLNGRGRQDPPPPHASRKITLFQRMEV